MLLRTNKALVSALTGQALRGRIAAEQALRGKVTELPGLTPPISLNLASSHLISFNPL